MDRSERCGVLSQSPALAAALAERVLSDESIDVGVLQAPTVGMVMVRMRDSARGEVFHLGEVLVTEARISIDGVEGWAMVTGREPEHALAAAIVDAALELGGSSTAAALAGIEARAAALRAKQALAWETVAATRVDFENF